jgi:hypothetical protein
MKFRHLPLLCWGLAAGLALAGCSPEGGLGDPPKRFPVDETKPTLLKDFSPKQASVRTLLFIDGENFGTELSNIKVFIGDKEAPVTGSNGKTITAMVPRNSSEQLLDAENGLAAIRVEIYKADGKTLYFDDRFAEMLNVKIRTNVGTLVGKKDPSTGTSSRIDGTFEEAEFQGPWWLELTTNKFDEKVLLVHDGAEMPEFKNDGYLRAVREVNLETQTVRTLLTQSQIGISRGLSLAMDPTKDTLFMLNDSGQGGWDQRYAMPAIYYALRRDDFTKPEPYQYAQLSYSGLWMSDGTFYYNTWVEGMLLKGRGTYNEAAGFWDGTPLFSTNNNNGSAHQFMFKHPGENYMYVTGTTNKVIKVPYDKAQKTFVKPIVVVAGDGSGFAEGTGTTARFNMTRQGVFVKNPDYTGEELYDFYMCDQHNHCIWKITPEGIATVFAGRGSPGLGSDLFGWIDGDPVKTARFYQPCGIAYDEETGIFYVADRENRQIRTIMVE